MVILGRGGAGKSALSRQLSDVTGIPAVELDALFWQPGPTPMDPSRWAARQHELVQRGCWIPSYSECRDAIETNAISSSYTAKIGQTICMQSNAAYPGLAAVHVLKWDSNSWDMVVDVTVWASQSS